MMYELRVYTAHAGRMPDLLRRFETAVLPLWEQYAIRQAGFWTALDDASNHDLSYLIAWESKADRELRWNAFLQDPQWIAAYRASEEAGPLVASMTQAFLQPTEFSSVA